MLMQVLFLLCINTNLIKTKIFLRRLQYSRLHKKLCLNLRPIFFLCVTNIIAKYFNRKIWNYFRVQVASRCPRLDLASHYSRLNHATAIGWFWHYSPNSARRAFLFTDSGRPAGSSAPCLRRSRITSLRNCRARRHGMGWGDRHNRAISRSLRRILFGRGQVRGLRAYFATRSIDLEHRSSRYNLRLKTVFSILVYRRRRSSRAARATWSCRRAVRAFPTDLGSLATGDLVSRYLSVRSASTRPAASYSGDRSGSECAESSGRRGVIIRRRRLAINIVFRYSRDGAQWRPVVIALIGRSTSGCDRFPRPTCPTREWRSRRARKRRCFNEKAKERPVSDFTSNYHSQAIRQFAPSSTIRCRSRCGDRPFGARARLDHLV